VIITESPAHMLDELNTRISDVVHSITEAEGREREAERRMREADDDMENARARRQAAEADKRAAAEDRERQVARFVGLLEQSLHEFRFMAGPRFDDHREDRRDEHREPERRPGRPHEAPHRSHQAF
jgi:chromosome segregation ATPase